MKLFPILLLIVSSLVFGKLPDGLPTNSYLYLPLLQERIEDHWPKSLKKSYFAAQIEQETCISLTHSKCWSPRAELKTSREYGFGFGQLTITDSFNKFNEVKALHPKLAGWGWDDRYDPNRQIIALILLDKLIYEDIWWTPYFEDKFAFMLAAYNGGLRNLTNDRELCKETVNCNSIKWFDNVEKTSWRSKIKVKGYGKSFFDINREYVKNIILIKSIKYSFMD